MLMTNILLIGILAVLFLCLCVLSAIYESIEKDKNNGGD